MSFFGRFKRILKPAVDVSRWVGYRELMTNARNMLAWIQNTFTPQKAKYHESFDTAIDRLKLTEADIMQRQRIFSVMAYTWFVLFLLCFLYAIYLIVQRAWLGVFPSLSLSSVMLIQAFRYHFWRFQIKQRKLGCSVKEWLTSSFKKRDGL